VSTGAENDLEQATNLVRSVVARFGMGDSERLLHCASNDMPILAEGADGFAMRNCSERTAALIDEEAEQLLEQLYGEARAILDRHKDALERVARTLLEKETLDEQEFGALVRGEVAPAMGSAV
jgi:cell division protease FtsH